LQPNPKRHFLSFHSPFIRFLPPFAAIDTTSVLRFHRGHQPWENFAERLPTIPELIGSVNTSAFVGTDPTKCPQLPSGP
jgi:hypothetical protein